MNVLAYQGTIRRYLDWSEFLAIADLSRDEWSRKKIAEGAPYKTMGRRRIQYTIIPKLINLLTLDLCVVEEYNAHVACNEGF